MLIHVYIVLYRLQDQTLQSVYIMYNHVQNVGGGECPCMYLISFRLRVMAVW